jgi:hypothetical protein
MFALFDNFFGGLDFGAAILVCCLLIFQSLGMLSNQLRVELTVCLLKFVHL